MPGIAWFQHLGEVLARLQFFPTKLYAFPYFIVYKQCPDLIGDLYEPLGHVNIRGLPGVEHAEQFFSRNASGRTR